MNPFGRAVETRPQLELDTSNTHPTSNILKPKFVPYPSLTQPITSSLNTSTNSNIPSSSGQNNEEVKLPKSLPTTMAPPVGGNTKPVYKAKRVFKVIFVLKLIIFEKLFVYILKLYHLINNFIIEK